MKLASINSNDIYTANCRLEAGFYNSQGAFVAKHLIRWRDKYSQNSDAQLEQLSNVCVKEGIFFPGRFARTYVTNSDHGEPWLSPTEMLKAELYDYKLISSKLTPNIDSLRLKHGWILISRSGSIGNMAYVAGDLEKFVASDDIIRVIADQERIPSGYLYAFLSSKLGNSLIIQQNYGGVIQHIEPHHIQGIPIPRLNTLLENQIHDLIALSASQRTLANKKLGTTLRRFHEEVLGISPYTIHWQHSNEHSFATDVAKLDFKHHRLDAFHYVGYVADTKLENVKWNYLATLINAHAPGMFKRPYVDQGGVPLVSGIDMYNAYPKPRIFISPLMPNIEKYKVRAGTILVQCSGQRYGLLGHPVILPNHLDNVAVSQHMVRVYTKNSLDRGFIYIWLSTGFGRRLLLKNSHGTSMGELSEQSFLDTLVPECSEDIRHSFEADVNEICNLRDTANQLEDKAQEILLKELAWNPTN